MFAAQWLQIPRIAELVRGHRRPRTGNTDSRQADRRAGFLTFVGSWELVVSMKWARKRLALVGVVVGVGATVATALPSLGLAQSAADIGTARHLATEGIEAFGVGDYEAALDRLGRAELLYEAPVHRLYIARSLQKLGRLIEASEMYRKLMRFKLDADAPAAFKLAVSDGRRELTALEPKIPSVTIRVTPEKIGSLDLRIDGEPVSPAVIGIARVVDPGEHRIRAVAPALEAVEVIVSVGEGEHAAVQLDLRPQKPSDGTRASVAQTGALKSDTHQARSEQTSDDEGSAGGALSFFGGVRLTGAAPGGSFYNDAAGNAVPVADEMAGGVGFGIRAGMRFGTYFGVGLLFENYYLENKGYPHITSNNQAVDIEATRRAQVVGLTALVRTKPGHWGAFGELGFTLENWSTALTVSGGASGDCTGSDSLSGSAIRLGGGGIVPVSSWFELSPFVMVSAGTFSNRTVELCNDAPEGWEVPATGALDDTSQIGHTLVLFGLGGDLLFSAF